ncbi:hypothetical protein KKG46_02315 [Patescibacteria group bacterium]|nr:hypothetical protein [Patescibacteria group bacterium]
MKIEIVPAILIKNKKDFFNRLTTAGGFAKTVQIDIMDGIFVNNKTPKPLNNATWYAEYVLKNKEKIPIPEIELHLMVINPWKIIDKWKEFERVRRIIWHVETPIEHSEFISAIHHLDLQACLAINPHTPLSDLKPHISTKKINKKNNSSFIDSILVMDVVPGKGGQKFLPSVLKTIRTLHKKYPHLTIATDGGINQKTAKDVIKAGATRLNAGGSIFLADDPKLAYHTLHKHNS